MSVKFVIHENLAECAYVRACCKAIDNTLIDADFEFLDSNLITESNAYTYFKNTYTGSQKPFLIMPRISANGNISDAFQNYPNDIPLMFRGFIKTFNFPSACPIALTFTPDRLSSLMLISGGVSGLSDWFTGAALQFTEEAPIMYLNSGTPVLSFAILNIVDMGSGVTKIVSGDLASGAVVNELVHISGATGWSSNPNGKFVIQSVNTGSGFITINHTLGSGAFGGSPVAKIHYMSGAISAAAAKIHKIMRARDCSEWEAVYCAYKTASNPTRDNTHGYGEINVDDAIAFSDTIIADPYDTLGAVGTLTINVNDDGVAEFAHPEITNARIIKLFDNDVEIYSKTMDPGNLTFARNVYPIKLGHRDYKVKGYRDNQETSFSNVVSTDIETLEDMPPELVYPESVWDTLEVYYLSGASIKQSTIENAFQTVTNPLLNNQGVVITEYLLSDGALVEESKLFASLNDTIYFLKNRYLNDTRYYRVDPFSPGDFDLCGMDFSSADMTTDGDYDFTGRIVRHTTFQDAVLPDIYSGPDDGLDQFLSDVAYCDPARTIWINGLTIEEELAA